jgi:large subunit ribosomal protein L4
VRNVPKIDFLPAVGINVYDILRRDILILSIDALNALNERFAK